MVDWSKAPYWANFAAMDSNGDWWWHEKQPIANDEFWFQPGVAQRFGHSPIWSETLSERATQAAKKSDPPEHDLYETSDADKPEVICDRNGEVALGLCKKCGRGEAELSEPCVPRQK